MTPRDDLPGAPLVLAIMLALVALIAVPVALALWYLTAQLPALLRARDALLPL
jgi:hypothetical protein